MQCVCFTCIALTIFSVCSVCFVYNLIFKRFSQVLDYLFFFFIIVHLLFRFLNVSFDWRWYGVAFSSFSWPVNRESMENNNEKKTRQNSILPNSVICTIGQSMVLAISRFIVQSTQRIVIKKVYWYWFLKNILIQVNSRLTFRYFVIPKKLSKIKS